MTHEARDPIRAAMEDDPETIAALVLAAVRARDTQRLDRVGDVAETSRDRQVVEIARAHLRGDAELVDALARDHLVDYPDSLVVAWIASDAVLRARREDDVLTHSYTPRVLSISVLGPVEVKRGEQLVSIPAGKTSELLVRLALEAGTVVRADRLVEDLWAEDACRTRRNTLQSKVAMLRRALGDPSVVVSSDGGYALAVDPADVDALTVVRDTAVAVSAARER